MFNLHEYVTLKTNGTYLPAHLPASLPATCLPACLPVCMSARLPVCLPAWVTRLRENATMDPAMQSCGNAPRIMQKRQASWTLCNPAAQSSVGTKHKIFNKQKGKH